MKASRHMLVALAVLLASLAGAASAFATEHHPKGAYEKFKDCPLSNPGVELCLLAQTESGEVVIGNKTVPIVNTITLQGGLHEAPSETLEFVAAEDGNTLSKSAQPVPGGLLGILAPSFSSSPHSYPFNQFINKGITGVTATTELAAPGQQHRGEPEPPDRSERRRAEPARQDQTGQPVPGKQMLRRLERAPDRDRTHDRHHQPAGPEQTDHRQKGAKSNSKKKTRSSIRSLTTRW